MKFKQFLQEEMAECTFHPKVDLQSTLMDKKLKKNGLKNRDLNAFLEKEKDVQFQKRVQQFAEKEIERAKKLSQERAII